MFCRLSIYNLGISLPSPDSAFLWVRFSKFSDLPPNLVHVGGNGVKTLHSEREPRASEGCRSFGCSGLFSEARRELAVHFRTEYVCMGSLNDEDLVSVDLLVIGVWNTTPLSTAEQGAMLRFVRKGGTLVANVSSCHSDDTSTHSDSILAPLGMTAARQEFSSYAAVQAFELRAADCERQPVLSSPFGRVRTFFDKFPSYFDDPGYAADSSLGDYVSLDHARGGQSTLALLHGDVDQSRKQTRRFGRGEVLLLTNYHSLADHDAWGGGLFELNKRLVLNVAANSKCRAKFAATTLSRGSAYERGI